MLKQIAITHFHVPALEDILVRWNLDTPRVAKKVNLHDDVVIKGWAVAKETRSIRLLIRRGEEIVSSPLDEIRQDVIKKVMQIDSRDDPRNRCGFRANIALSNPVQIGFLIDFVEYWVAEISLIDIRGAVEGGDGHLFLENDSNRSRDQYAGRFLIAEEKISEWTSYFQEISALLSALEIPWVFLLAPGKEYVFPEYCPYQQGKISPVDQLLAAVAPWNSNILYPLQMLTSNKMYSFSRVDTHWTDYGALEVAKALTGYFGDVARSHLPRFHLRTLQGDLGGKLDPVHTCTAFVADFGSGPSEKVFDNQLKNTGRIVCWKNSMAENSEVVMVFGGSSSDNLARWLSLIYKDVVVVHSLGMLDLAVLEVIRPTRIILQTHSRFIVRSQVAQGDVAAVIREKIASWPGGAKRSWYSEQLAQADTPLLRWSIEAIHHSLGNIDQAETLKPENGQQLP